MIASDLFVRFIEEEDDGVISTWLELTNHGKAPFDTGWRLYFSLGLSPVANDTRVSRVLLDGRYGYIEPTGDWQPLQGEQSVRIQVENWLFSGMSLVSRQGFHLAVIEDGNERLLGAPTQLKPVLVPLTRPRMPRLSAAPYRSGVRGARSKDFQFIPQVTRQALSAERLNLGALFVADSPHRNEMQVLSAIFDELCVPGRDTPVRLVTDDSLDAGYRINVTPEGITLSGQTSQDLFHAVQTLRQMIEADDGSARIPAGLIEDSGDFSHRGFFLDIARHFQPAAQIRKTIEAMSTYKLNRLQLGISNDEGWRLEIAEVPELTRIGSRRAYQRHNPDGSPRALYPAWGDDHKDYEGFLTRDEFVDLLRFAASRHVEIIPELNLPGHANAILRSLDAAGNWQLTDPADKSVYRSAQGYTQNVVNPGLEDSYRLAGTLIGAIRSMYADAGVPFTTIHLGGDEVPDGAWLASPACRQLPVWDSGGDMSDPLQATAARNTLMAYHYDRIVSLAVEVAPGIQTGFWHEMSPHGDSRSYYNAWVTRDDSQVVTALLQRNQQLVISNASFLYLDMPYAMAADEPGLPWAAYIDTRAIYEFDPLGCWQIPAEHEHQVLGIQAQLWSETIFTQALMDYHTFPRLLAVAERAWNRTPVQGDWPGFREALETRELPFLDKLAVNYRSIMED